MSGLIFQVALNTCLFMEESNFLAPMAICAHLLDRLYLSANGAYSPFPSARVLLSLCIFH